MIATKRKSRMPSDCEIEAGSKILLCATTFRKKKKTGGKEMNRVERFRVGKWAGLASGRLTPKASVFAADSIGSVGGTIIGGRAHPRK